MKRWKMENDRPYNLTISLLNKNVIYEHEHFPINRYESVNNELSFKVNHSNKWSTVGPKQMRKIRTGKFREYIETKKEVDGHDYTQEKPFEYTVPKTGTYQINIVDKVFIKEIDDSTGEIIEKEKGPLQKLVDHYKKESPDQEPDYGHQGISRRDWFAGQALKGALEAEHRANECRNSIAEKCVGYADALISQLDKGNNARS